MRVSLAFLYLFFCQIVFSQNGEWPKTEKSIVVDTLYSTVVTDEYRWLEDIHAEKTMEWIEEQNSYSRKILRKAALKFDSYNAIDKYSYVKYDNPIKEGDYYFTYAYYNNVSVPALFYQSGLKANPKVLVDPNFISTTDKISLKNYKVSKDSKLLAYQFSRNGSDWGEIKVIGIKTASNKKDHLFNVKFSGISWRDDGFYYSKYPAADLDKTIGQEIYYHKIGTEQAEDELVFKRANNPEATFTCQTTEDERFLIIKEVDEKKSRINLFYIDFNDPTAYVKPLITRLKLGDNISILGNKGDTLIASTFKGVNNGMLIKIDTKNPRVWHSFVPEYPSSLLLETIVLEDKIINIYQSNRKQQILFFDYQGEVLHAIQMPFGFSVGGFNGQKTDKEILFSYEGYTQPKVVYVLDVETFEMKPLRSTVVNYDYTQFETKELEYESFDGTKVPLFMIYQKGLDITAENPTLLNAYGGFGSIVMPNFSPGIVHFLKEGGIFAFANIRGGSDKGKEWVLQGKGENKQNSFKDFIAAAEFLIENNYSSPDKLAITGGSNGGLVVGVAMTQRPDLFKVAVPVVAPFDMIRLEKFTIGHYHADEYGSTVDSAGFFNLLSYSPLHHVKEAVNYPATMIMTSENDDRVPPLHSYKFAAKLQNRVEQKNQVILRVEEGAGHYGATSSFKRQLKEDAAMYDFILYHLMGN